MIFRFCKTAKIIEKFLTKSKFVKWQMTKKSEKDFAGNFWNAFLCNIIFFPDLISDWTVFCGSMVLLLHANWITPIRVCWSRLKQKSWDYFLFTIWVSFCLPRCNNLPHPFTTSPWICLKILLNRKIGSFWGFECRYPPYFPPDCRNLINLLNVWSNKLCLSIK